MFTHLFMKVCTLAISPSGPIDHQLSVTGDEAVSEASDVDEPVNAEGVCYLNYTIASVVLYFSVYKCTFTTHAHTYTHTHTHTHSHSHSHLLICREYLLLLVTHLSSPHEL